MTCGAGLVCEVVRAVGPVRGADCACEVDGVCGAGLCA